VRFLNLKVLALFTMALVLIGALGAFFYTARIGERNILVEQNTEVADSEGKDECANPKRRPIAVMIAEDREARPLSGIAYADIVVEMPVVTGSITRMMAIFICEDPGEIGSVRSARHDFIPLAQGFDAILAHWGGSHFARDELRKGVIDNLDAMPNYFDTFYRKDGVPAPHDGFTSMARMSSAAEKLGYRMTSNFEGYKFEENSPARMTGQNLEIGYRYPYNVMYEYNPETNSYLRWRGGAKEIDALNGEQVETNNVALMRAASRQIDRDYNDVDVVGEGEAVVYRNGEEARGVWIKKNAKDMLRFYDENGRDFAFAPGKIWINIIEP
jgi:hypothetical protein